MSYPVRTATKSLGKCSSCKKAVTKGQRYSRRTRLVPIGTPGAFSAGYGPMKSYLLHENCPDPIERKNSDVVQRRQEPEA